MKNKFKLLKADIQLELDKLRSLEKEL